MVEWPVEIDVRYNAMAQSQKKNHSWIKPSKIKKVAFPVTCIEQSWTVEERKSEFKEFVKSKMVNDYYLHLSLKKTTYITFQECQ